MRRPLHLALPLLLCVSGLAVGGQTMAIEEPSYQVITRADAFEVRRYQPVLVAEVEVPGELEDAGNRGFSPLADYIFGNNVARQKIAMTAPVTQQPASEKIAMTAPVTQQQAGDRQIVRFTMPAGYTLETLPVPRNPAIKLRQLASVTYAVVRYSGRWTAANYRENLTTLRREIAAHGLTAVGAPIWARYDAPFIPWFMRRNEVMIAVQ
jgi:hypothetical protein